MVEENETRKYAHESLNQASLKAIDLLNRERGSLEHLDEVVDTGTAEIYRRLIPSTPIFSR